MKKFVFTALTLVLFTASVLAQSTSGRLVGTISGPDGVIPGATITVIDNQTKRETTVKTSDEGAFAVQQLEFGTYTVNIAAQGFKNFTATELKIDANREYSLNPTLEVGGVNEEVTIVAGADIVNSANGELSNTVSPRQVLDLPLNGRNPLSLLNTVAGSNATSNSINGQRSSSVNYTRDGVNVQDNFIRNGFVQDRPSVDDTGEFTVITQNAGAENGGGGSTQVQLVTPRGGSDFHGALFGYNRNSYFAANDFFSNAEGVERSFLNRNQFGGKVGGPVVLPRFGEGGPAIVRGKAFFFASYERFLLRQQATVSRNVLVGSARNGTYTYTRRDNGQLQTINVLTGAGLNLSTSQNQSAFTNSGGVLSVDPIIQGRILDRVPTAGSGTFSNGGLSQSLSFNQTDNDTRNGLTGRFDIDFNDNNSFNFVYKFNDNADDRPGIEAGGFSTTPFARQGGPTTSYIAAYRRTIGSFNNEVRGGYVRSEPFFTGGEVPNDFIIGGLPFLSNPNPTFRDQGRNTDLFTVRDDASYTFGNHSLRFGGQYQYNYFEPLNFAGAGIPTLNISTTGNTATPRLASSLFPGGISTTEQGRADSLRYLLGGIIGSASVTANLQDVSTGFVLGAPAVERLRFDQYSFYVSDQWKVTPRLTLNYGLRYELFTPLESTNGLFLEPVIPQGSNVVDALLNPNGTYDLVGGNAGSPGKFFRADKNNFGPVVSVAYAPQFKNRLLGGIFPGEGRTVIRGGYRIGYINDEFVVSNDSQLVVNSGLGSRTVNALQNNSTNINARLNNPPTFTAPAFIAPPRTFVQNNQEAGNFGAVFAIDPNLQVQQNHEYNVGIQREIGFQTAIEINYVGGFSHQLVRTTDFNQVDIRNTGFLNDFLIARENLRLARARGIENAAFNASIPGSRPTPIFNLLPSSGSLASAATIGQLDAGTPGQLARNFIVGASTARAASNLFLANPNTGIVALLSNDGRYNYNSLQFEIRRRFSQGLAFQANYTFQKILTDTGADSQTRFDPLLDNVQPELEYSRADYDRTHTVNINANYELPFGGGKRFLSEGGFLDRLVGGFQLTTLINISSGTPISIRDPRGTLNRDVRSARQTANSNLSTGEIKNLVGIFRQNDVIYAINPSVIAPDGTANGGNLGTTPTAAFAGQVFFNAQPGETGNLPRAFINGPRYFNIDAALLKNIKIGERARVQLRAEAFNLLNNVNFFVGDSSNIFNVNSSTFGQITSGNVYDPRIMQFAVRFEF